jgi:hypothetical protein
MVKVMRLGLHFFFSDEPCSDILKVLFRHKIGMGSTPEWITHGSLLPSVALYCVVASWNELYLNITKKSMLFTCDY